MFKPIICVIIIQIWLVVTSRWQASDISTSVPWPIMKMKTIIVCNAISKQTHSHQMVHQRKMSNTWTVRQEAPKANENTGTGIQKRFKFRILRQIQKMVFRFWLMFVIFHKNNINIPIYSSDFFEFLIFARILVCYVSNDGLLHIQKWTYRMRV